MALDFEDGWREAATGGWWRRVEFGMRASGDLAVSLLREWTRGARVGVVAATAGVTALLWGLALRPWSWPWQTSPRPRHAAVVPVTEAELFVLAGAAMLPVLIVLLFVSRLVQRRAATPKLATWRRRGAIDGSYAQERRQQSATSDASGGSGLP
jgi:hypothetical protein